MERKGALMGHRVEARLAPDVDPAWAEDFILALRLRGVGGAAIADALAEVNDEVRTSGRSVEAAFGPAGEYAGRLDLPVDTPDAPAQAVRATAPAMVGFVGMMLTLEAVLPVRNGTPVGFGLGMLLLAGVVCAGMIALALRPASALGFLTKRWVGPVGAIVMAGLLVGTALLRQEVLRVPAWPVGVAGVLLLVVTVTMYVRTRIPTDPLEPPLARTPAPARRSRANLVLAVAYPVVTLLVAVGLWYLIP